MNYVPGDVWINNKSRNNKSQQLILPVIHLFCWCLSLLLCLHSGPEIKIEHVRKMVLQKKIIF